MATDERGVPVSEGDQVSLGVQAGMVQGQLVKLPGGLSLPGQQPGQAQIGLVAVVFNVQVLPNGVIPGVFKLAEQPGDKKAIVH